MREIIRKLKSFKKVKEEGDISNKYPDGAVTFTDGTHINTSMVPNFGKELRIVKTGTSKHHGYQYRFDGYSYKECWFEEEVNVIIDGLFADLLEDL